MFPLLPDVALPIFLILLLGALYPARHEPGRVVTAVLLTGLALIVALGFMLGAFGQIPINDFMIGKMASGPARAKRPQFYPQGIGISFVFLRVDKGLVVEAATRRESRRATGEFGPGSPRGAAGNPWSGNGILTGSVA